MSKNKVDGKQTKQGYVSFGYKQLANCEEFLKKVAEFGRKTPSPQALPPAVGLKSRSPAMTVHAEHMDAAQV